MTVAALWVLVVLLILLGLAGTVLPALPGTLLVLGGIVLGAWIDDFTRVGVTPWWPLAYWPCWPGRWITSLVCWAHARLAPAVKP